MSDKKDVSPSLSQEDEQALRTKINFAIQKIMEPYFIRYNENADRIINLVRLYVSLKQNSGAETSQSLDDMLRTCVVFTHATLEDFLRTLAAKLLPLADENILNQIPLLGVNALGRPDKFQLGSLAQFRGKAVEDVIQDSVASFLQRSNYNNITDIVQLLKNLNVDVTKVNQSFPLLEQLMERRHLIVHRADRSGPVLSNSNDLLAIEPTDVVAWLEAVLRLISDILSQTAVNELMHTGVLKKEGDRYRVDL